MEPGSRLCLPCLSEGVRGTRVPLCPLDVGGIPFHVPQRWVPPPLPPLLLPRLFGLQLPASISKRSLSD